MTDDTPDDPTTGTDADQAGPEGGDRSSPSRIEQALSRLAPPGASVSALAVRAADGEVVAAADPDRSIAPASNTKLVTAALALDALGPDHRFETALAPDGRVEGRVLDGDLVLRGSGAPDLGPDGLATLADGVAADLDRVDGDLVCDVARFDGPQLGPGRVWSDALHAYGARSSALAFSGNVVTVTVAAVDGEVTYSVAPETDAVDVEVAVAVGGADRATADERELDVSPGRAPGALRVEGTVPPGETRSVTVPIASPVRHCGLAARDALAAAGVAVTGGVRVVEETVTTERPLASAASAPVRTLVRSMNVDSDNFVAEQLARAVAATVTGEGSWAGWETTVADHLADRGVDAVDVRDGSGLSRYNRLPARAVVALLQWARERPWREAFFDSLPAPGEGTLAERLDGVPVVAKTGTLTGARALSGRVASGDDAILFSVLVGGLTVGAEEVRDRQDAVVRALAARAGGDGSP